MKNFLSILLILFIQSLYGYELKKSSMSPPVELTSFTASVENGYVNLMWTTAGEINNNVFEIERIDPNTTWQTIGTVDGYGTTVNHKKYEFRNYLSDNFSEKYAYRLKQIDFDGTFNYSDEIEVVIKQKNIRLLGNYPNPFNPTTKIKFQVTYSGLVSLKVYDVLGNEVATLVNEEKAAGNFEVEFDATNLTSGIYFYQMKAGNFIETKKMILLR